MGRFLDCRRAGRQCERGAARPPLLRHEWQDDAYYRGIRDAYLLASNQLRDLVAQGGGDEQSSGDGARFLLDQYLNAVSPTNFAFTNPEVVERTKETGGANLVQGFPNLVEDIAAGKGIVQRRTDPRRVRQGRDDRRDARARSSSRTICSS